MDAFKMNKLLIGAALLGGAGVLYWGLSGSNDGPQDSASAENNGEALVEIVLPDRFSEQAKLGERAFDAVCADCHGTNAVGRDGVAPPLIHKIYEPSHHGDGSFLLAVQNGVRAHHWKFGNMPPVEGVTQGDVKNIIAYVREIQRANGIN